MDHDRLRGARAEAEAQELRRELERLSAERLRLGRKNERLSAVLCILRERERDETVASLIEDALGFDGTESEPPVGTEDPSFTLLGSSEDD
jgi:hypothetical protein